MDRHWLEKRDMMPSEKQNGVFKPLTSDKFRFACHKDMACFTKCCAALKLVLTPYDILRMKNRLHMSSSEFLERYSETVMDDGSRFPMLRLKMNQEEKKTCPFVTPDGCTIYEDRPGACRIYPLGRASMKVEREKDAREKFFVVQEAHCLGFNEEKEWTVEAWLENQGLDLYNAMNDAWLEIITSRKGLGPEKDIPRKMQMFFMASYNLDMFRSFLLKSRFFDLFEVEPELREDLGSNDVVLMHFAFQWLKFSLFGEKTLNIKGNIERP